jgi:integrase/recombinase XerD
MASYKAALSSADVQKRSAHRKDAGSFGYVCRAYYASVAFKLLDVSTQSWRRRALDSICERHGDKPIKLLLPIRDELSDRPGAARNRLKALRALFRWAVELDHAEKDPTRDIKPLPYVTAGHHAWSLEEVEIFEAFHPIGSKARLAMALMLYTACRREDAVRLGPQHIRHGRLQFRQAKNEHRNPVDIDIPLHPDLVEIIETSRSGHLTFLVTEYGRPFSAGGFGNKFREWCDQCGLTNCSAHGLRKAAAARLAERGASAHEIMAITGHRSLEEVERYTRAVRRSKLADSAMSKLKG